MNVFPAVTVLLSPLSLETRDLQGRLTTLIFQIRLASFMAEKTQKDRNICYELSRWSRVCLTQVSMSKHHKHSWLVFGSLQVRTRFSHSLRTESQTAGCDTHTLILFSIYRDRGGGGEGGGCICVCVCTRTQTRAHANMDGDKPRRQTVPQSCRILRD